jgi:hypothetical protein
MRKKIRTLTKQNAIYTIIWNIEHLCTFNETATSIGMIKGWVCYFTNKFTHSMEISWYFILENIK